MQSKLCCAGINIDDSVGVEFLLIGHLSRGHVINTEPSETRLFNDITGIPVGGVFLN